MCNLVFLIFPTCKIKRKSIYQRATMLSGIATESSQLSFFPEIVESNEIGKLTEDSFTLWEPGKNNITIGFDDGPEVQSTLMSTLADLLLQLQQP